jgi:ABC-2 type transport system permease protein
LAPLDLNLLMLSKTSGAILFGLVNAFVPVLFASFLTRLSGISWLSVLCAVLLIAITSTLLGLFIAVSVREVFEAQTFSNFFRFPMIFLCGLFISVEALPFYLRPLSYILPLTYGVDILKSSINHNGHLGLLPNFLILLGFSVLLFAWSIHNVQRRWIY